LNVPADGTGAVLSAASTLGLFRGLNTFAQLWYTYDYGKEALDQDGKNRDGNGVVPVVYTLSAPVAIQDSPAYVSLVQDFFPWDADMNVDIVAISWVHARHGTEFVSDPLLSLFDTVDCRETYDLHVLVSFPVSDIERTLDAMSWIHVRLYLSSIARCVRSDGSRVTTA
jgi:hypothetical protein